MLLDCLKSLEAAEDVRAGEVTLAEMTSRLSEFADDDEFSLDAHLLGTLRENEGRGRGPVESVGGDPSGIVAEEDFSLKRQVGCRRK